jgi:hypothetical protein
MKTLGGAQQYTVPAGASLQCTPARREDGSAQCWLQKTLIHVYIQAVGGGWVPTRDMFFTGAKRDEV